MLAYYYYYTVIEEADRGEMASVNLMNERLFLNRALSLLTQVLRSQSQRQSQRRAVGAARAGALYAI